MLDVEFEFVAWNLWTSPINKSIYIHYQWSSTNWQHSCAIDCWTFARQTWLHKISCWHLIQATLPRKSHGNNNAQISISDNFCWLWNPESRVVNNIIKMTSGVSCVFYHNCFIWTVLQEMSGVLPNDQWICMLVYLTTVLAGSSAPSEMQSNVLAQENSMHILPMTQQVIRSQ